MHFRSKSSRKIVKTLPWDREGFSESASRLGRGYEFWDNYYSRCLGWIPESACGSGAGTNSWNLALLGTVRGFSESASCLGCGYEFWDNYFSRCLGWIAESACGTGAGANSGNLIFRYPAHPGPIGCWAGSRNLLVAAVRVRILEIKVFDIWLSPIIPFCGSLRIVFLAAVRARFLDFEIVGGFPESVCGSNAGTNSGRISNAAGQPSCGMTKQQGSKAANRQDSKTAKRQCSSTAKPQESKAAKLHGSPADSRIAKRQDGESAIQLGSQPTG